MAKKPPVKIADSYGILTVVEKARSDTYGSLRWWCACACGNPRVRVPDAQLHRGPAGRKSCGECNKWVAAQIDPLALALLRPDPVDSQGARLARQRADLAEVARLAPAPGAVFGCLRVTGPARSLENGARMTECSCNCGKASLLVPTLQLIRGRVTSCGCLSRRES